MPGGRPPKPIEQKRKTGRTPNTDSGGRKLPELTDTVPLPMAEDTPPAPNDLSHDGVQLWERAWDQAITWISPVSDVTALEEACRLADDLAVARTVYRSNPANSQAGKIVAELSRALTSSLGNLGFDPAARSRLGLSEVKRVSKLEQLRQSRGN